MNPAGVPLTDASRFVSVLVTPHPRETAMSSLVSHLDAECLAAVELARLAPARGRAARRPPGSSTLLYNATSLHADPALTGMAGAGPRARPPARNAAAGSRGRRVEAHPRRPAERQIRPHQADGTVRPRLMRSDSGMSLVLERGLSSPRPARRQLQEGDERRPPDQPGPARPARPARREAPAEPHPPEGIRHDPDRAARTGRRRTPRSFPTP